MTKTQHIMKVMNERVIKLNMLAGDTMADAGLLVDVPSIFNALKNNIPYDELLEIANNEM